MATSYSFDPATATGAAENVLKEYYAYKTIQEMLYKDAPLLALLKKKPNFVGKVVPVPIRIGTPQGRSATFATAQSNASPSVYKDFGLTVVKDYAVALIDNLTMELSATNEGAFIDAATSEIDGAIMSLKRSIAWSLYGNGGGRIGVAGAVNTNVITLTDPEDVVHFEIGQVILANANDWDGTAGTARTAKAVTAIDRDAGKITLASGHNVQQGDSLFVEGDRGSSSRLKLSGLRAWMPDTAPSSGDAFFGVDRSVDAGRLAGRIYDGSAEPLEEALIGAARRVARDGGRPDYCFVSFAKFAELEKALGTKAMYDMAKDKEVGLGFKGIRINGPKGDIMVLPDADCPGDRGFLLQMDTWALWSVGELARLFDGDGNRMLRQSNADGFEVRCVSYPQLACHAPGYNCLIKL